MMRFVGATLLSSAVADFFCPSAGDFTTGYGKANFFNQGWTVYGGGAAATKASFDLIGGYVEFDIDVGGSKPGVVPNIYTISPSNIGWNGFNKDADYCDGAAKGNPWCMEIDWLESNGNCGGQTAFHTKSGPGDNSCDAWGCIESFHYNGKAAFHMRIEHGQDGEARVFRDGQLLNNFQPSPGNDDWGIIQSTYQSRGAVIYSSQWTGDWTPVSDCGAGEGDLEDSQFTVSNLVISGKVVQGPSPARCAHPPATTTPAPAPVPATTTTIPRPTPTTTLAPAPTPTTPAPGPAPSNPACSAHTGCVGLLGNCCPHDDGMMLACCSQTADVVV